METFKERIKAHADFGERVFLVQGLLDDEIAYLYTNARFLVFCSYMEGYGLPLTEAIQRGTPVLAADMEVSREVAGDYCDYFAQDKPQELIHLVEFYETHEQQYQERKAHLQDAAFISWDESTEMMRQSIVECAAKEF